MFMNLHVEWRVIVAAVAWTTVIALATARAVAGESSLTVWSILAGNVALVFTGWMMLDRTVERAKRIVIEAAEERDEFMVERVASSLAATLRDGNVSPLR